MSEQAVRLLDEALLLTPDEREELADRLLASLGFPQDDGLAARQLAEVEDTLDAIDRHEMKTVSAKEAFETALRKSAR